MDPRQVRARPHSKDGPTNHRSTRKKADARFLDICSIWRMRFETILLLVLFFVFLCTVLTVNALLNFRINGYMPPLY